MKRYIIACSALTLFIFVSGFPGCPSPPKIFNNANVEITGSQYWIDRSIYEQGRLNLGALYQNCETATENLKIYSQLSDADEYLEVCTGPTTIASCITVGKGPSTYVRITSAATATCAAEAMRLNYIEIRPDYALSAAEIEFTDVGVTTMLPTLVIHTADILDPNYEPETVHQFKIKEDSTCTGKSVRGIDATGSPPAVETQLPRPYFFYVRQGGSEEGTTDPPEITATYPVDGQTNIPVDFEPWFKTDEELGYVAAFVCKYESDWSLAACYESGIKLIKEGPTTWKYECKWRDDLESDYDYYGFTIAVGESADAAPDPGTRSDWVTKITQDVDGNVIMHTGGPFVNILTNAYYDADLWVYRYRFATAP